MNCFIPMLQLIHKIWNRLETHVLMYSCFVVLQTVTNPWLNLGQCLHRHHRELFYSGPEIHNFRYWLKKSYMKRPCYSHPRSRWMPVRITAATCASAHRTRRIPGSKVQCISFGGWMVTNLLYPWARVDEGLARYCHVVQVPSSSHRIASGMAQN